MPYILKYVSDALKSWSVLSKTQGSVDKQNSLWPNKVGFVKISSLTELSDALWNTLKRQLIELLKSIMSTATAPNKGTGK